MGLIRKILPFLVFFVLLTTGCKPKSSDHAEPLVVVTEVEIDYQYRQNHLHRNYTDSDKMDVILYYLYDLSPYGKPDQDPEQIQGDSCKITVTLSNGQQRIYRQIGSAYLSVDFHPWQKISETKGALLYHLVNHIKSDF